MMKLIQFSVLLLVSSFSFANIYIYQGIFDNQKNKFVNLPLEEPNIIFNPKKSDRNESKRLCRISRVRYWT